MVHVPITIIGFSPLYNSVELYYSSEKLRFTGKAGGLEICPYF